MTTTPETANGLHGTVFIIEDLLMRVLNIIGDWIVAKPYRYWIAQWFLYSVLFLVACFTVACFFILLTSFK